MARGMKLNITVDHLDEFVRDMRQAADTIDRLIVDVLRGEAGDILRDEARSRTPIRTGRTMRSIEKRVTTRGVEIGGAGPVGTVLESGAPPHIIRARGNGALRIGQSFVDEVHHPGTRGRRIMSGTLRHTRKFVENEVLRAMDNHWLRGGHRA